MLHLQAPAAEASLAHDFGGGGGVDLGGGDRELPVGDAQAQAAARVQGEDDLFPGHRFRDPDGGEDAVRARRALPILQKLRPKIPEEPGRPVEGEGLSAVHGDGGRGPDGDAQRVTRVHALGAVVPRQLIVEGEVQGVERLPVHQPLGHGRLRVAGVRVSLTGEHCSIRLGGAIAGAGVVALADVADPVAAGGAQAEGVVAVPEVVRVEVDAALEAAVLDV